MLGDVQLFQEIEDLSRAVVDSSASPYSRPSALIPSKAGLATAGTWGVEKARCEGRLRLVRLPDELQGPPVKRAVLIQASSPTPLGALGVDVGVGLDQVAPR